MGHRTLDLPSLIWIKREIMAGPMMFSNGVSLKRSETVKGARDERAKSETG